MIDKTTVKDMYPLSPMQEGILFHHLVDKNSHPYFEQVACTVNGNIDHQLFDEAFNRLIERYDILRTIFLYEKVKRPLQIVLKKRKADVYYEDISTLEGNGQSDLLKRFKEKDKNKGFDLSKNLPIRIAIIKTSREKYEIIWSYHHIVMDGWCSDILRNEMMYIYRQLKNRSKIELPGTLPYGRFIRWLEKQDKKQALDYWKKYLENYESPAGIPKIESERKEFLQTELSFTANRELTEKLTALSNQNQVTVSTFFHTVWGILLQKYNNTGDVVFGSVVSGRSAGIPGIEDAVGLFINTTPVRVRSSGDEGFEPVLKRVQREMIASGPYEHVPLVEIQSGSHLKKELVNHIVAFENYSPVEKEAGNLSNDSGMELSITGTQTFERTNYDLDVIVEPGRELLIRLRYNSLAYHDDMISKIGEHLMEIMRQVTAAPGIPLKEIEILPALEKKQLLYDFNDTRASYPETKTIHELFREQVKRNPHHTALIGAHQLKEKIEGTRGQAPLSITYRQLNEKSHRLAGILRERGVMPDTIVGIMVERSIEMIVGIFGILKAGGAYLPIDPHYPEERKQYILKDSGAHVLVTTSSIFEDRMIGSWEGEKIFLEPSYCPGRGEVSPPEIILAAGNLQPAATIASSSTLTSTSTCQVSPTNLAYIIYTSGSTGKPKGVLIDHRNVVRLMINDKSCFDFTGSDIWTLFHSYCFDFSVWEMYGALLYGGKLNIIPRNVARDPVQFISVLKKEKVTVLNQTPSAFYNLILTGKELALKAAELKLRYIIFGGEALNPLKLKTWKQKFPGIKLVNMFGITETTVHVTYKEIEEKDTLLTLSNIGTPIPTLTTYVMDRNLKLLPIGVSGELCVGGEGVAAGYLNRVQLTAEKFVENPYKPGEKLYRSGDLGKLSPDGNLEYLGRIDQQVKVRGYRVEVGEIENRLLAHDEIKEAVVILKNEENGDKFLCAYIVGTVSLTSDGISALKEYLSRSLPDYMIPSYFIEIDKIPLTANGKIDGKALAGYKILTPQPVTNLGGPSNKTEEKLVETWKNILAVENVGINDNFFNVGGDSIKAIRLVSAINNAFKAKLKVVDVFTLGTIKNMAKRLTHKTFAHDDRDWRSAREQIEELKAKVLNSGKLNGNIEGIYPMSDIEKGMIFHAYNNLDEAVYHDQFVYRQKFVSFEPGILKKALRLLMEKHPILRTSYNVDDFNDFVHIVHKDCPTAFAYFNLSGMDKQNQEKSMEHYLEKDRRNHWDIKTPPLWRLAAFDLGNDEIGAVWTFHHAILDGWSNASFMTELNNTYIKLKSDQNFIPGKLNISYEDFILQEIVEKNKKENINFWKKELAHYKRTSFPVLTSGNQKEDAIHIFHRDYGHEYLEKLESTSKKYDTNLKHLLFAAYMAMMNMLSRENDVVVGLVSNKRPEREDGDKMLGCFLNTLPFRLKIPGQITWRDYVRLVENKLIQLKKYEKVTFYEIVKIIGEKNRRENPVFDSIFSYIHFHIYDQLLQEEIEDASKGGGLLQVYERTNTLFDFRVTRYPGKTSISLIYSTTIISDETIEKLFYYFDNILNLMITKPAQPLKKDDIISKEEKQKLLFEFNNTQKEFPGDKTIHEIFRQQVERVPDHTALIGQIPNPGRQITNEGGTKEPGLASVHVTYKELDEKSNHLAHLLREKGVGPDVIVGIMVERSIEMLTGIIAILKAEGAYLPLDPDYPEERIKFMLTDSGADILVTMEEVKILNGWRARRPDNSSHYKHHFLEPTYKQTIKPTKLAYVIYTSGSTGNPKGVLVEHRSVVNLVSSQANQFKIDEKDRALQFSSICFDASVQQIFIALSSGAVLVLIDKETLLDPEKFETFILLQSITYLHAVPSFLNNIDIKEPNPLRLIISGGDVCPVPLAGKLSSYSNCNFYNEYGPTETTVASIEMMVEDVEETLPRLPIGKPLNNTKVYICDQYMGLVPPGVIGELYIGGAGVARGYLNNPEATAKKILPNPFVKNEKVYKTGDLAMWLPDGNLEYCGRIDYQVKIRGFRIEPGEMESQLSTHDKIKEAVVTAVDDRNGNKNLCAYLVSDKEFTTTELRDYLSQNLPEYMLPSYFISLDKIPLTPNGKVDRKNLPDPKIMEPAGSVIYAAPRHPVEKKLAEIWENVLGREKIGLKDNFFELGGDSIKVIQIVSRMRKAGYKLDTRDVLQNPQIAELAPLVKKEERIIDQSIITGPIPLTPIQKRFFENRLTDPRHFNQAVMLYSQEGFGEETVKVIFSKLQEHHDALRMTFTGENGKIIQFNHDTGHPLSLEVYDFRGREDAREAVEDRANRIQAGIDLVKGPLMKLGLFHLADGGRLLIVIHHLVMDGISWRILLEDIEHLFARYKNEETLTLPLKTDSYKTWARQLREYANSESFLKEKAYWQGLEAAAAPVIKKDFQEEENLIKDSAVLSFSLNEKETELLLTKVNKAFGTEINDILLTALGLSTGKTFGHEHLLIALEGHGREEILKEVDISRTIGWFTTLYPVLLDISHGDDLALQVKVIKETLRRLPHKGIGYGILKYLTAPEHKEDIDLQLNPQISFNYLGQFDAGTGQMPLKSAKESPGETESANAQRHFEIDISGMINAKRLEMSITYNKKQYKPETIQALTYHYKKELQRVTAFCSARETRQLTPSDLTYKKLPIEFLDDLQKQFEIEDVYPLTPMQEGMLFHSLLEENRPIYLTQSSYRLHGELDIAIIQRSLNQLFRRYDILRTAFIHETQDRPVQVVPRNREVNFYSRDIRAWSTKAREKFIKEYKEKDINRIFDLRKEPLMRVAVIQLDESRYEFTWTHHHILIDGWCLGILITDFFEIYNSYVENRNPRLLPVTPYKRYIQWLEHLDAQKNRVYWKEYLEDYEEAACTGTLKYCQTSDEEYKKEQVRSPIDKEKLDYLNELAGRNRVTLNNVFRAAWGILLGKYTGKQDVLFGAVVSGRPSEIEGVESMVGLFINTIPVRIRCEGKTTIKELLQKVQEEAVNSETHHHYPLIKIQAESLLKQNLLDHIFIFENFPIVEKLDGLINPGEKDSEGVQVEITGFDTSGGETNYDFNVKIIPGKEWILDLSYNANVFEKSIVERIVNHFNRVFDQIINDEEIKIEDIILLSAEEKRQLLDEFNCTNYKMGSMVNKTIHRLFDEQAEQTPDAIALVREFQHDGAPSEVQNRRESLTYRQLNERSGQLAQSLRARGLGMDNVAAVMTEPCLEMIVGILAVMKCEACYLPIDPLNPGGRIEYLLTDSEAKMLLTHPPLANKVPLDIEVLNIRDECLYREKVENPGETRGAGDLVYMIYTSGTTGNPKGVLVKHENLVNYVHWFSTETGLTGTDKTALISSFAFDLGYTSIYPSLLNGAQLYLLPKEIYMSPGNLLDYVSKHGITYLKMTPSLFSVFVADPYFAEGKCRSLRLLVLGGEAIKTADVETAYRVYSHLRVMNHYGPTEATIGCIAQFIERENLSAYKIRPTIGRPIFNTQAYILDKYLKLLPVGIAGELCVSGAGTAKGYFKRDSLTSGKFILFQPFTDRPPVRIYRTGDLARWLPDRRIEFLGRTDQQVKIRGFRIEIGEIERTLLQHEHISSAAVVANENEMGINELAAYYVSGKELEISGIRSFLGKLLPDYMIPSYFIHMDDIPLTSNGKIDRKLLPDPQEYGISTTMEYVAPGNETEKKLVEIWQEVLGIEKIGINNNFFESGGDSLKAIQLVSRIKKGFGIDLSVANLFRTKTIEAIAKELFSKEEKEWAPLVSLQSRGSHPPIFCIPFAAGNVAGFTALSNSLGDTQPCYALQHAGMDEHTTALDSVDKIAGENVKTLTSAFFQGPFFLAGHCFGGFVALEMANQLHRMGYEIGHVFMFNTFAPHPGTKNIEEIDDSEFFQRNIDIIIKSTGAEIELTHNDVEGKTIEECYLIIQEKIKPQDHYLKQMDFEEYTKTFRTYKKHVRARFGYKPVKKYYDFPVTLCRADETEHKSETLEWDKIILSNLKVQTVPGGHFTLLHEPNVKILAQYLKREITGARK